MTNDRLFIYMVMAVSTIRIFSDLFLNWIRHLIDFYWNHLQNKAKTASVDIKHTQIRLLYLMSVILFFT